MLGKKSLAAFSVHVASSVASKVKHRIELDMIEFSMQYREPSLAAPIQHVFGSRAALRVCVEFPRVGW